MNKYFLTICILPIFSAGVFCQPVKNFEMPLPDTSISNSLYNQLQVIDSRPEKSSLGTVRVGMFDRRAKLVTAKPLTTQINEVFNKLIDKTNPGNKTFVLQIRDLRFNEITGMVNIGYCNFRAVTYARDGDNYQKIKAVDTIMKLRALDVTNDLLAAGSTAITNLIVSSLIKSPSDVNYTASEVMNMDSTEKQRIKLYTTSTYTDGLYLSYDSFKNQVPDKQIIVNRDFVNVYTVKAIDEKGIEKKIKGKVYGLVYKGLPYIFTGIDYYALKKVENDFIFTGNVNVGASESDVFLTSLLFGPIFSGIVAGSGSEGIFEMKLNHRNGSYIILKKIVEPPPVIKE